VRGRRRFFRFLFKLAAAMSLMLCVATTAVMWLRSYRINDEVQRETVDENADPDGRFTRSSLVIRLGSHAGGIYLAATRDQVWGWDGQTMKRATVRYVNDDPDHEPFVYPLENQFESAGQIQLIRPNWRRLGFDWNAIRSLDGMVRYLVVPYWSVMFVLLLAPALVLLKGARRRGLRAAGCCPACGYDLRATPERCPECGTSAP
jgi:hypothetical protein